MKKRIAVKPVYFYEEDQEIINEIDNGYVNFQKLIKTLLSEWIKKQKSL